MIQSNAGQQETALHSHSGTKPPSVCGSTVPWSLRGLHWTVCVQLEGGGGQGMDSCVGGFMGQAWRWPVSISCTFHWSLGIKGDREMWSQCVID